jgi:hypothetical protein
LWPLPNGWLPTRRSLKRRSTWASNTFAEPQNSHPPSAHFTRHSSPWSGKKHRFFSFRKNIIFLSHLQINIMHQQQQQKTMEAENAKERGEDGVRKVRQFVCTFFLPRLQQLPLEDVLPFRHPLPIFKQYMYKWEKVRRQIYDFLNFY